MTWLIDLLGELWSLLKTLFQNEEVRKLLKELLRVLVEGVTRIILAQLAGSGGQK